MPPAAIPIATYRLQFNASFTFEDAAAIVDYLDALGVSHCYASSYFKAVPGSTHGYDVADPTALNPEIGDESTPAPLGRGAARARHGAHHRPRPQSHGDREVGQPLVAGRPRERPELALRARIRHRLAPAQAGTREQGAPADSRRSYGAVLERQEIALEYHDGGVLPRGYFSHVLPIAPGTYDRILGVQADVAARRDRRTERRGRSSFSAS